jgi:glycosyltransferase involved in cell wall biosynthesis
MNILITRFPYESALGGEESHTIEIAKGLRKKGHNIYFLGSCPILLKQFKLNDFKVMRVWGGRMPVTPFELIKFLTMYPLIKHSMQSGFKKAVDEWKISNLYCLSLGEKIILTPLAQKNKIKTVWLEHQQIRNWLLRSPLKYFYKKYGRLASIIPISPSNTEALKKMGIQNIFDIPNGVKPLGEKIKNKEKLIIGTSGRLTIKKGINHVIDAFKNIQKQISNVELHILGSGPEEEKLRNKVQKENISGITFLGHKTGDEYKKNFLKFDIFVLASIDTAETFGIVASEALISGIPLVVTSVCGITKYLDDSNASMIPPENSVMLSEAIIKIINNDKLYDKLSTNGKKVATEKFSYEKMLNAYEKLLMKE